MGAAETQDDDIDRRFMPGFGAGEVPGRGRYSGEAKDTPIRLHVFDWDANTIEETTDASIEEAAAVRTRKTVSWVNVSGIHDTDLIRRLGRAFELHDLTIEDILNPRQRPKVEHYPDYAYLVLKMAFQQGDEVHTEQVSVILAGDFVMTFQEDELDVFGGVRTRLRTSSGRVRKRGHDYLAYALMDAVVDSYLTLVEAAGERVELVEDRLEEAKGPELRGLPSVLHEEKRELMALRKMVLPLRDAVSAITRDDSEWVQPLNVPYFRDLHDHLVQLVESIDIYRDMIASLLGLHLSLIGQQTNEEMRVLTVIATIFIPLTFLVGVYGMNFDNIPELHWPWAYPALWVVMVAIAVGMVMYFRRRGSI